jgi:neutral trehalase
MPDAPRAYYQPSIDEAIASRRTVLVARRAKAMTAHNVYKRVREVIEKYDLTAMASTRRVGDEYRVYVHPIEEDCERGNTNG